MGVEARLYAAIAQKICLTGLLHAILGTIFAIRVSCMLRGFVSMKVLQHQVGMIFADCAQLFCAGSAPRLVLEGARFVLYKA